MAKHRWYFAKRAGEPFEEWKDTDTGSMWFPYAEKFMARFPLLAVRVFYVLIKIKRVKEWLTKIRS